MRRMILSLFLGICFAQMVAIARTEEIHLDCARTNQSVAVDVDTSRLYVQLMWSEGVAEEFQNGESYVSGANASGGRDKVTYAVSVENDTVTFGQDRVCIEKGADGKCAEQHLRNTLDVAAGVLKYDEGDMIGIFKCVPAPPGRKF